jgi:saccharopine dehydrogenase (NAD+, L-lysine forming)
LKTGHGNSIVRVSSSPARSSLISVTDPNSEPFPSVSSYPNENELIADVKKAVVLGSEKTGKAPRVLIIGALGRCGSGAIDLCLRAGVPTENVIKWDLVRTPCVLQI